MAVNATIARDRPRGGGRAGRRSGAQQGFTCIKLKVGVGDDAGARGGGARGGRARGRRCAWTPTAPGQWRRRSAAIEALAPAGLELVEEPTHGLQAVRAVRERVSTRVAIDETAAEHGALGAGVADAVCLKICRCGGISGLLAAAALVRASGAEVVPRLDARRPAGQWRPPCTPPRRWPRAGRCPPCGLATLRLFEGDVQDALPVRGGRIALPSAAGLGVDPL